MVRGFVRVGSMSERRQDSLAAFPSSQDWARFDRVGREGSALFSSVALTPTIWDNSKNNLENFTESKFELNLLPFLASQGGLEVMLVSD